MYSYCREQKKIYLVIFQINIFYLSRLRAFQCKYSSPRKRSFLGYMHHDNHFLQLAEAYAGVGSWHIDVADNTLRWSDQVYNIHGVSRETYTPGLESALAFYHPEDRELVQRYINGAIAVKEPFEFELRIVRADGDVRWVHSKGDCLLNDEGEVVAINGIFLDITERREAEELLKESEERLKLAIMGSKSGIWDWIDVNGDTEWWSPQFYELLGYENEEIEASLANFGAMLHPEDKERTFALVEQHFAGEADFDIEYRLKTKSGAYRWFRGYGVTRRDASGKPMRMVGSITDIHEAKTASELLKTRQLAVDAAITGIAILDASGCYTYMNTSHAGMYGYTPEEMIGESWEKLYDESMLIRIKNEYFPILMRAGYWSGEVIGKKKNNHTFEVEISLTGLEDGGLVCVCQDITQQKNNERILNAYTAALERSNKELDDFAYVASHDLKSPLRAIANLATWITEDAGDLLPEDSQKHLDQLVQRAERMEQLLEDLLQYSRAGRDPSDVEDVDTGALLNDVIDMLAPPETFKIDVAPDLPSIESEASPIQQVFLNLISNAIKHHDRLDGTVRVSWKEDNDDMMRFIVEDDGPGIEPAYHDRIFKIFQTLKPRDEVEGSGMGLAIVKKILRNHGGDIALVSSPGEGARFEFTWPKKQRSVSYLPSFETEVLQ